jgi:hypothetical protein
MCSATAFITYNNTYFFHSFQGFSGTIMQRHAKNSIYLYLFCTKNCKTRKVAQILFRFLLFLHKGPGVSFIPPAALQKRKPPPAYYAGSGVYCTSKYVGHSHFFRTMTTTATAVQRAAIPMMAKKP